MLTLKPNQQLSALLRLTRWRHHVPFVVPLTILGAMLAVYSSGNHVDWRLAGVLIGNILAVSAAFVINDVIDAPDDALDPEKRLKNVISSKRVPAAIGMIAFWLMLVGALVLYVFSSSWAIFWGTFGIVLAYLYSAKPFRLKARPVVDIISHVIGAGSLPLLMGYFVYDDTPGAAWYVILTMTFASAYGQFYNQIDDYDLDKAAGLRNTTILLGKTAARVLMYSCIAMAMICIVMAFHRDVFPDWLATVIVVGSITCALFVWKTDMRGNTTGIDAMQIPVLIVLNFASMLWLAWSLGFLTTGMP